MTTTRILIVEDDAILVTHLEQTLIQSGYQVAGLAATGEAAVESALAQKPDAILMDIRLRGEMTGIQAAAEIHRQIDTPIIFLTAYTDEEMLQQAKITDAYAFLAKPVRDRELRASLEMALYKHATERRLYHLNQVLRAVRDINQLITHEHNRQQLLTDACQILVRTRGYRLAWIGLPDGSGLIPPVTFAGQGWSFIEKIGATPNKALLKRLPGIECLVTKRAVTCHDMPRDERYAPWRTEAEAVQFHSTVAIPMLHADRVFGVLNVYADQSNLFDAEEAELLVELANDLAFGLKAMEETAERKQAEEALRASANRLREAQRMALIGDWELNLANNKLIWSDEIYRIFEIDPAKFGASYEAFLNAIHPDDRDTVNKAYTSSLETRNSYEIDHRLLMPDGRLKYVHERCETFYAADGHPIRSVGTVQDITERQKAEQAIRESEERFSTIFHASPIPILIVRASDGKFVDVNDAFQSLSGYGREEVIGSAVSAMNQWVDPGDLRRLEMTLREQGAVRNFDASLRTKSGVIQNVLMSAALIEVGGERYVVNMAYDITARKQHENELHTIASLSAALRSAPSRTEMISMIAKQLVGLLNCETVSIEIIDPLTGDAVTEAAHGIWEALIGTRQKSAAGINTIISQTRQPYFTNDLKNDPNLVYPEWTHHDIHGCIGAPLISQDHLIGFLWAGWRTEIVESEVRLLASVADMSANAIYRTTLYEQSQKDAAELVLAYDTTLEGWAHALELRDQETEGHTRRVMQMTVKLAQAMGIDKPALENVRRGALLHDIGKMGIPDSILLKPGTLNEREWEIMHRHPEYAYKFLEPIEYLHPVIDIPYCHHEKWDGSGYPRGLEGEQIPFIARIFAIVDVWDALRSDRPYRTAWTNEKTLKYIVEQSGKHFDPQVVQMFLELLRNE